MKKLKSCFLMVLVFTLLSGCVPPDAPTPTPTYLPTSTFTPIPTLSPEEAYRRINELLSNNDNCRLPCWLGIMPGHSTSLDVQTQLTLYSNVSSDVIFEYPSSPWVVSRLTILYMEGNMNIEITSGFLSLQGEEQVTVIGIDTRAYKMKDGVYDGDVYGYQPYFEMMKPYSLAEVMSTYGPDSQIYVNASLYGVISLSPHVTDFFLIHLWYPDKGIFMKYKMAIDGIGENYQMCPSDSFISGYFLPPGLGEEYIEETLLGFGGEYIDFFPPTEFIKSAEEAFGMTNEEFYQLFLSSPGRCLETPKEIWWP